MNRDPWIQRILVFLSNEGLLDINDAMHVCDLFVFGERRWDVNKLCVCLVSMI